MTSRLDLGPDEMRQLGYAAVDLLVERWETLGGDRSRREADRRDLEPLLREPPPEDGRPGLEVLERAAREILPVAGRIDHPRFFAFVPSSPTWPSVLADFLATGYNIFQGTWYASAGPSQVELVVVDWFRQWFGMPEGAGGLFTSGGSVANLTAVVAAREAAGSPAGATMYVSDQGHSSLERAGWIAGIARSNVRKIKSDQDFRLDLDALREAVAHDRAEGLRPVLVAANGGAANTGTVDDLRAIGSFCRDEGLWFHVDGAYGGFAVLVPDARPLFDGIGDADSLTVDPHKWLYQPYETGCLLVRDPRQLEAAFRVRPEYLQDTELGQRNVNFAERGPQLTRAFRALKVWMSFQTLGARAHRDEIARGIGLAKRAGEFVEASPRLRLMSPPALGIVCFRYEPPEAWDGDLDELNERVQDALVAGGWATTSSTRLRGRYTLRLCVLNYRSTWDHVRETLERIETIGAELAGS